MLASGCIPSETKPKVLNRLCERAGVERITAHILRHTFAATAAEMGYPELVIGGLLGHNLSGVTARYAHMPDPALVAAAERVSARIAERLEGQAVQQRRVSLANGLLAASRRCLNGRNALY